MKQHLSESRTENAIRDLLNIQGWSIAKPPKGQLIEQNEYKNYPIIADIFKGKSKTGAGDGYPDFLIVSPESFIPRMVIEAKASVDQLDSAISDAIHYAEACKSQNHEVIAIGVAGQESGTVALKAFKFHNGEWKPIVHMGNPISWIPTPDNIEHLLNLPELFDLAPVVPRPEVLAEKADEINRILREAAVKDEYRPAYVGAMMLALWQSEGQLRRDSRYILKDINDSCQDAFRNAGKSELAKSLAIDEANEKLANSAWKILAILEKLNVVSASFDHDYLGQLYETFFRYTGGNTIGQYFTPRHITRFMVDLCEVTQNDVVIDPACGTGGFLISSIHRAVEASQMTYEDTVHMVKNKLIGYESEPVTAALCVANMILRGDGKTGVRKDDCFTAEDYPVEDCRVALMNPPFPHKSTDTPPEKFIERALEALQIGGKLAVIVPSSFLVKSNMEKWRASILKKHSLFAVCQLPDELFQPYASATTSVVMIEKGIPHNPKRTTSFVRIQNDGLMLKKSVRVIRPDKLNELDEAVEAVLNKKNISGFSGTATVNVTEWSPGAYIPSAQPTENELKSSIDELLRRFVSFYMRYAPEIATQRRLINQGDLEACDYRSILSAKKLKNAQELPKRNNTIGQWFEIYYGQKELHSREGIPAGNSLIISPTEQYNGCYGWLDFPKLLQPSFITVAQTGSIGEAFVQLEACAVNDDCLILMPRNSDTKLSALFVAAAIIRLEKWRFNYGRKLTPARIADFYMSDMPTLFDWVDKKLADWLLLCEKAVESYL